MFFGPCRKLSEMTDVAITFRVTDSFKVMGITYDAKIMSMENIPFADQLAVHQSDIYWWKQWFETICATVAADLEDLVAQGWTMDLIQVQAIAVDTRGCMWPVEIRKLYKPADHTNDGIPLIGEANVITPIDTDALYQKIMKSFEEVFKLTAFEMFQRHWDVKEGMFLLTVDDVINTRALEKVAATLYKYNWFIKYEYGPAIKIYFHPKGA